MQKLSKRLQAVADFVSEGSCAADIGTDHGFLPIYLIQSGKCPSVIAMDIRKGPLERAREHIAAAGLSGQIRTRLSDGMLALKQGEADSVVIAGMGGLTILHILEEARGLMPQFKELVLEPQSDLAKVRRYLREHNLAIDREELVQEAGKYYPILHVDAANAGSIIPNLHRHKTDTALLHELGSRQRVQGLFDQYGACNVYGKHPLLRQMLEREEKRETGILQSLETGLEPLDKKQERAQSRRQEVKMRLEEIRALLHIL